MTTLNPAQREAVTADDGPALVLAGAGSGKTRVIVERIVWLVEEHGVDPRRILALTFTNRAANEMKERVAARLGVDRLAAWVGTFHAFGLYVLRREIQHLGRPTSFTIFDDGDQLSLMKRLLKALPNSFPKVSPRDALEWVSRQKQSIVSAVSHTASASREQAAFQELWRRYDAALLAADALDFDDLLLLSARVLTDHKDVREKYQQRYRHVLVDEYQDTNRIQYHLAKLLTESHRNIFAVGDEDQSIYSWRGAEVGNILDFEKDFPGARVFRLEDNYRSTAPILNAANAVVANNEHRLGKTLRTTNQSGEPVRIYLARDAEDEARFVVEDFAESGVPPNQTAVLFRTNGQARTLEEALRRKGIPYVIVGGIRFYSRKEVKDLLCYLRLLVNPADDESVRRVINVPLRGIGAATVERFEEYASSRGVPLTHVLREIEHDQSIGARSREAASSFVHLIDDLAIEAKRSGVAPLVETLLERAQYREFVRASDEKDFRSRLEIVDEFVAACQEFDARKGGSVLDFLQELALFTEVDEWNSKTPSVTLMTCHSAKGLEFDSVYLIGLEEGLLPHAMSRDSERGLEEERRLCYVAMTRARKRLTLAAAESRTLYGLTDQREISRFVREIPPAQLQVVARDAKVARVERAPAASGVEGQLKLGMHVFHPKFGQGYVAYTSGTGENQRARIRFKTGRSGTFLVSKTPLSVVEEKKR